MLGENGYLKKMEAKVDKWEKVFNQPQFLDTLRNKELEDRKFKLITFLKYSKVALVEFG